VSGGLAPGLLLGLTLLLRALLVDGLLGASAAPPVASLPAAAALEVRLAHSRACLSDC
jgi:hypothetical protein